MAGAHCTVLSLLTPSNNPITTPTPPLLLVSSIPSPKPSKIRHRKNYLRLKILKTLTKPYPPITPLLQQEPPPHSGEVPADGTHGEKIADTAGEGGKMGELQVSETTGGYDVISGLLSGGSIFKYGVYLVGVFVFQTICSVWILGNDQVKRRNGDLEINGREKRNFLFHWNGNGKSSSSNVSYVEDQLQVARKIEDIKLMAREARRIEEKKKVEEVEDPEIGDGSAVSSHRPGIQKEISARLLKLQNRINFDKDKSPALQINSGNSVKSTGGVTRDNIRVNQGNEAFMFKKKLKYRSPSTKPTKTPKGFPGIRDREASGAKKRNSASRVTVQENGSDATVNAQISYKIKQVNLQDVETRESVSGLPLEEGGNLAGEESKAIVNNGKNLEEKTETPNVETETGLKTKNVKDGHSHAKRFQRRRTRRTL